MEYIYLVTLAHDQIPKFKDANKRTTEKPQTKVKYI